MATENMDSAQLEALQTDLIAVVYNEAVTQLLILKQSQQLDANVAATAAAAGRRTSATTTGGIKEEKWKSQKWKNEKSKNKKEQNIKTKNQKNDDENRPSAVDIVLEDIRMHRELSGLIDIYTVGYNALSTPEPDGEEITREIEARNALHKREDTLRAELLLQQRELKSLKQQITSEREAAEQRMSVADERIGTLRHKLQHVRRINELELNLVERWEESRYTQACIVGEKAECALQQKIALLQRKLNGEQRIICEVDVFRAKEFAEYRERIAQWQRKYAAESAKMEAELCAKRQRRLELCKMAERHREVYAQRVQFVADYALHRQQEERLLALQQQRMQCAVQIQAWWRGVMVRRGLGPFKKKPKKSKKGKVKGK